MVQQAKAFAANPDGLSLIDRTHIEGSRLTPASSPLISTGVLWHACPTTPTPCAPLTITIIAF